MRDGRRSAHLPKRHELRDGARTDSSDLHDDARNILLFFFSPGENPFCDEKVTCDPNMHLKDGFTSVQCSGQECNSADCCEDVHTREIA